MKMEWPYLIYSVHAQNISGSWNICSCCCCFWDGDVYVLYFNFILYRKKQKHIYFFLTRSRHIFLSQFQFTKWCCRRSHKTEIELFSKAPAAVAAVVATAMMTVKRDGTEKRCFSANRTIFKNKWNGSRMEWSKKQANIIMISRTRRELINL